IFPRRKERGLADSIFGRDLPILRLDKFSEIRIFEGSEQNGRARFFQGEKNVVLPIRSLVETCRFYD
ncbi:MAG: hypothetical protein F6K40_15715, partial [Okeania sp. SIO3I5]|uniref:hypothetical protein n=1 Tax=Okeania sp. SIO3I5 TaxID=2607805 RepID=UPI0013BAD435